MIDNRLEYQRMFDVERKLWWYQILHNKVLHHIKKHFDQATLSNLSVLDAACGTGGLLTFLKENGLSNTKGFDYSAHAVDFSLARELNVVKGDLRHLNDFNPGETFDVICCNDALYFLNDQEIIDALRAFKNKLRDNGLIIINIHAFEAFSGTHDLAVGSSRRFTFEDFVKFTSAAGLTFRSHTYWPFALSLPILAVRQWQKYQIRKHNLTIHDTESDVSYPGDFLNGILRTVVHLEEKLIPRAPFGSSLFMVMEKS